MNTGVLLLVGIAGFAVEIAQIIFVVAIVLLRLLPRGITGRYLRQSL